MALALAGFPWGALAAGRTARRRQVILHDGCRFPCLTGSPWPDDAPSERGSVLIISGEDDPADTIRPRLNAHHADVLRVHLLSMVRRIGEDGKPFEVMFSLHDLLRT